MKSESGCVSRAAALAGLPRHTAPGVFCGGRHHYSPCEIKQAEGSEGLGLFYPPLGGAGAGDGGPRDASPLLA